MHHQYHPLSRDGQQRARGNRLRTDDEWNPPNPRPQDRIPGELTGSEIHHELTFEWKDIHPDSRLKDIYNYLADEKKRHIRGEKGERFVTKSELNEKIKKAKETTHRETRNEILREIHSLERYQNGDRLRLADLGQAVGLSPSQVSRIVNEE